MRRALCAVVVLALTAVTVPGADEKPKPADTPAKTVAELKKESDAAQQEVRKKYEAMTEEEKKDGKKVSELFEESEKAQAKRYEAAFALAKADPKSETAAEAVNWLLGSPQVIYKPLGKEVLVFATEHVVASPQIGQAILTLGRFGMSEQAPGYKETVAFLKAVEEKNKDKGILGQVAVVKAWQAKSKYEMAEHRKQKDADELATTAEKAFEAAAKEYGEVKLAGRGEAKTIADVAKVELFELRSLRVGKTAPDIEGEDLDGTKFKLSDYKGKVTVVTFWGSWCGPCMGMVPHERSLVERLKDKPFALIGVNSDTDKSKLKKVMEKEKITWRSFWCGTDGPGGPIPTAWNVRGWPTIYVLDAKGVIRAKNVRGQEMDKAVDGLLEEMGVKVEKHEEKKEEKKDETKEKK